MNLDRFNLNLFVAFEALSKADTLTQAAGALYVTQSTLSVALRQMREYFDDELFVYKPKHKELTPLAKNLRPLVLEILKTAKATLMLKEQTAGFDRTTCLALAPDDSLTDIAELYGVNQGEISQAGSQGTFFTPRVAGLAARGALANAKSQSHFQRRVPKSRSLAELD
jgi:hypothetical protein